MIKKLMISVAFMIGIIFTSQTAYAEDAQNGKCIIYEDTQKMIDQAVDRDKSNRKYIDSVVNNFLSDINTSSDELNNLIIQALVSLQSLDEKTQNELYKVGKLQEELIKSQKDTTVKADMSELYDSALNSYANGIRVVRLAGAKHTAEYMEHAIVPYPYINTSWAPSTFYHSGDTWARELFQTPTLFGQITDKFETQILLTGKQSGTISGSFEFTKENSSLDAFTALHGVNYSVTFTKTANGYNAAHKITDVYDFAWNNYEKNYAVNFANNFCYGMQQRGWIKPYSIIITY